MEFANLTSEHISAPQIDEFELCVFGPGTGECIVLHLGSGDWLIVDSCRYPKSELPIALDYLYHIGVNPRERVKCILATHWHDDHVSGLAELVRQCPDSMFVMSAALNHQQFFQLVLEVNEQNKLVRGSSSASEFAEILSLVEERSVESPRAASDGYMMFEGGYLQNVKVRALSPSPTTIVHSQTNIAAHLLCSERTKRFKKLAPNDLSVAVQVSTGARDLLLKADLENSTNKLMGWQAVLSSRTRPHKSSDFVKIGHHGSENAYNETVWSTMVNPFSTSVVTPFAKLSTPLPREEDISRIKSHDTALYATTWPAKTGPIRRHGVDGLVKSATKKRHSLVREAGFVRVRFSLSNPRLPHTVQLFGSASRL